MFRVGLTASAILILFSLAAFSGGTEQPLSHPPSSSPAVASWLDPLRSNVDRLLKEAQADQFAWNRLAELTDTYGNRLSGSDNLTRAIAWAVETMKKDGLENVRTEKVMVPRWVRGNESAEIVSPSRHPIAMLGLGGSVATPLAGIEADVIVVRGYEDLNQRATEASGKIVLYNAPFITYGQTNQFRTGGASAAARHGAVASLVRTPHTGGMNYSSDAPRIPAAAISAEDADRIGRLVNRGERVRVRLRMEARFEPDVESANVIGEIRGSEFPEEIVLVGGHFDSWDVGTGASDDGVGCVVTWEAARLMTKLGIRPRRTVRVVLFTNEENGLRGGTAYRDAYVKQAEQHVLAIESDSGVFTPSRLGVCRAEPHCAARDARNRDVADAAGTAGDRAWRRRRGHRSHRPGRQGADARVSRRSDPVLHYSPHPGGYDRSDRAGGCVACGRCARRSHLRRCRFAGAVTTLGRVGLVG